MTRMQALEVFTEDGGLAPIGSTPCGVSTRS